MFSSYPHRRAIPLMVFRLLLCARRTAASEFDKLFQNFSDRVQSSAAGWVRTSLCARPFGTLLVVEHKRLVALGAAQLHTRVVYRQRFAVGRYDTMDVANDLAVFLEIKGPSVRID